MKAENIEKVAELLNNLDLALGKYNSLNSALTTGHRHGHYQVMIQVTQDHYGNGRLASTVISLPDSVDGKKLIASLIDKAWTDVVNLRCEIRSLGVEL